MSNSSEKLTRLEPYFKVVARVVSVLPMSWQRSLLSFMRPVPTRIGQAARYILLKNIGLSTGISVTILENVYLKRPERLTVGSRVSIHPMTYIDATGNLSIGSDVSIAHGVTIMTTEHDYSRYDAPIREAPLLSAEVRIGNDVWIGAGVKVLAGVSIGNRVVIGAGAVVTKDIPSDSVAVGVPARVVKQGGVPKAPV